MECARVNTASIQAEVVSELGTLTLRNEATCQSLVCMFSGNIDVCIRHV
jgi:hypothetical protein